MQSLRDPCFFDPPPGDQFTRTISNDSNRPVSLVSCDDARCRRGYNEAPAAAGGSVDVIVEACSVETYAVTDSTTHQVLGCLHEEGDELGSPASASDRQVTRSRRCDGARGSYVIEIYDPSR